MDRNKRVADLALLAATVPLLEYADRLYPSDPDAAAGWVAEQLARVLVRAVERENGLMEFAYGAPHVVW